MRDAALAGEFLNRGKRRAAARRHVHVGEAGVDGGEGVDAARRKCSGRTAVERGEEAFERLLLVVRLEHRLRRSRVHHHDLIELVRGLERLEVGLNRVDGFARRAGLTHVGAIYQSRDRGVRLVHHAGADVLRPRFQIARTRRERSLIEHIRPLAKLLRRREEVPLPDVVPAERERGRFVEVVVRELRQRGDHTGRRRQPAGECGEAERGRTRDASARTDQPQTYAALGHDHGVRHVGCSSGGYSQCTRIRGGRPVGRRRKDVPAE